MQQRSIIRDSIIRTILPFLDDFFLDGLHYIYGLIVAMSVSRIESFLLSRHINKSNIN